MSESNEATEHEPEEQAEPEEFLNRAARRAKGKKHGRAEVQANDGANPHARSVVQSRRQYGNRRTG